MKRDSRQFKSGRSGDRRLTTRMSRRRFLLAACAAGIGALPFIQACKEDPMEMYTTRGDPARAADAAAPSIPPIDRAAPAETLSATFGMG